ncbi:mesothelin-like isoform X2 [Hemicordylus capensis]|uniref:mesothelin-like isoform X2 n=1 Tax=Hemicordylus capensis TaxID=884348 RepID=UPI0023044B88|nr:mesothelin-like isoform X2 [Hemicordylus capensis]
MLRLSRIFSCFLVIGWAMATMAGSKPIYPCNLQSKTAADFPPVKRINKAKPSSEASGVPCVSSMCPQIMDGRSLKALGSAVAGLSSSKLKTVPPQAVLDAVKDPRFARQLEMLLPSLKTVFVEKLIAAVDPLSDLLKYVPNGLVPYIPKPVLAHGDEFSISDLNRKPWTPDQAAMFFDDILKSGSNFSSLSPSVLKGFTCAAASYMDTKGFQQFTIAIKQKQVQLNIEQLRCLERFLVLHNLSRSVKAFPTDLFLILSPENMAAAGNCKDYTIQVGSANIDLLEKGSLQRRRLLQMALLCLKIFTPRVSKENAGILGHLVCDLDDTYIRETGENLLKQLSHCRSFSPDQVKAIQEMLLSGYTHVGSPSKWSFSTLEELSGLFHLFDHNILKQIPQNILIPWLKCFIHTSHLPRSQLAVIVKNLQSYRTKRASGCPPIKTITEEVVRDDLMPIYYSPAELRACLRGRILESRLGSVTQYSFTNEQLGAVKANLDEVFPKGYPDPITRNLGGIIEILTPADINMLNISSAETLAALLSNWPRDHLAALMIEQYAAAAKSLDSGALNAIGLRYICLLKGFMFSKIDEKAIKSASLGTSRCSQSIKDNLYLKAKQAFSDQKEQFPDYYNLIKPYLGGASGQELKELSKHMVNMDISTFFTLRRDSFLSLTTEDVRGLLGIHLEDLNNYQHNHLLKEWIHKQKQVDLDLLNIGLFGGIPDLATSRASAAPLAMAGHILHAFPALLLTLLLIFSLQ